MYTGGCLCGGVRYEIHGPITNMVMCHCSQCRKVQGSAFATNGVVQEKDFVILRGEELLNRYEYGPNMYKYFCSVCASPIISKNEAKPGVVRIRVGTIESDITERPTAHIFVGSKANWDNITDDLPQYEEFPPM